MVSWVLWLLACLSCQCKPWKAREQSVDSFVYHLNITHVFLFSTSTTFLSPSHLPRQVCTLPLRWSVVSLNFHQASSICIYILEVILGLVWLSWITVYIASYLHIWMESSVGLQVVAERCFSVVFDWDWVILASSCLKFSIGFCGKWLKSAEKCAFGVLSLWYKLRPHDNCSKWGWRYLS